MVMAEWALLPRPFRATFVLTCVPPGKFSAEYVHTEELYCYQHNTAHCLDIRYDG